MWSAVCSAILVPAPACPVQELCGGGSGVGGSEEAPAAAFGSVRDLADMVCADSLAAYLPMELRWLQGLYEQKLAAHRASGRGLVLDAVLDMLAMNEEVRGMGVTL